MKGSTKIFDIHSDILQSRVEFNILSIGLIFKGIVLSCHHQSPLDTDPEENDYEVILN